MKGFLVACVIEALVWIFFRREFLHGEISTFLQWLVIYGAGFIANVLVSSEKGQTFDYLELAGLILVPAMAASAPAALSFFY